MTAFSTILLFRLLNPSRLIRHCLRCLILLIVSGSRFFRFFSFSHPQPLRVCNSAFRHLSCMKLYRFLRSRLLPSAGKPLASAIFISSLHLNLTSSNKNPSLHSCMRNSWFCVAVWTSNSAEKRLMLSAFYGPFTPPVPHFPSP